MTRKPAAIAGRVATAFVTARPCHSLTLAHLFLLLWLAVSVFYAAQYAGSHLLPGLVGEWHDPTITDNRAILENA